MTSSGQDLLFGVLAVQLGLVSAQQVMAAAGAWAADRSRCLAERLEEDGAISPARRKMIEDMVSDAVRAHDGDARETLLTFGGEQAMLQSIGGSVRISTDGELSFGPEPDTGSGEEGLAVTPETQGRYSLRDSTSKGPAEGRGSPELGRGGMGRVLVAFDEHLGREVAVKELLPDMRGRSPSLDTPEYRASDLVVRFLREARVTGQLEHPNIVPVYELGRRGDGTLYYTMKIVRGRTLADELRKCRGIQDRLKLLGHFVDVAQAVAYAHSRGVVHRDIKPENVMLGEFGETVLLDWGLAK
ncbi:MAG: serine/threonine protein kinase, partial [Deltaproteobacteria bacterium]|nr:serine/threonine protein kinase [Deltaproteobacteria bacterium]